MGSNFSGVLCGDTGIAVSPTEDQVLDRAALEAFRTSPPAFLTVSAKRKS